MYFMIYQDQKEKDGNKGRRASEEAGGSWKEGKKRRDRPNAWVYIPGMSNFIVSKINQASIFFKLKLIKPFLPLQIVAQLSGLLRHEIMDFMFSNPTMLDDLDFLYKSDTARKLMFYYQV